MKHSTRWTVRGAAGALGLAVTLVALPLYAQDDERVTTSAFLIPESEVGNAATSLVNIGLRRGIREVEGVRFVHPVDVLSAGFSEQVQETIDQLDAIADMVRTGDAADAARRALEAIQVLEANLRFVRRTQLVDAYMLAAIAHCRAGQRDECHRRIRDIVAFREGLEFDEARYGPEFADAFNQQKVRALSGPRGALMVETEPAGAEVYVDGRSYGPSPIRADGLLAGRHYVTVKELGYDELIARAEVRAGRESTERYDLNESENALRVLNLRPSIRSELGERSAGPNIRSLASSLGTSQVIVGVVRPAAAEQIHVQLYLYHVHTRLLQAQTEATLSADEAGMERARQLALELYDGVDLTGGIEAPEDDTVIAEPQPELYEQWWFWVAVIGGALVVTGAIVGGVLAGEQETVPGGFFRIQGDLPF